MYLTSDLTGENAVNDNITFTLSLHYNSIPFSEYVGVDPNIVNVTDEDLLKDKLYNTIAKLGYNINSVVNNYGTINIKLTNGKELNIE